MAIILNIQVYVCIYFVFLHTEGHHNKKEYAERINYFLHHSGWKNINDVKSIMYWSEKLKFENVINNPVTTLNCDISIRHATIFLGCSYANDLNNMFNALTVFQAHCNSMLFNINETIETVQSCVYLVLKKINEIVPLATLMKQALNAIEIFHTLPWNYHRKSRVILRETIRNLQNKNTLKKLDPLLISPDTIYFALSFIEKFLLERNKELKKDMEFCELIFLDVNVIWKSWIIEFDSTARSNEKSRELIIFLSNKISNLVQTTYQKKYIELGFKFDLNTKQTFLPSPPTNDNQDTTQNLINLTDHTNEVNMLQMIQQHDIVRNLSINSIQPTNELDKQDGIKKRDITQYKNSINLIQHSNDVDIQEDITQYPSINLMQPTNEVNKQKMIKEENYSQNLSLNLTLHTNEVNMLEEIQQYDNTQHFSINLMQPTNEVDKQEAFTHEDDMCEKTDDSNLQIEYIDDKIPFYKFI
ncbi:uncharacterized protein LOC126894408 isoform X2 [Daktulosphaira vitifoliae]|uniref:uncharacterized protein LOC126894408 isoform X2 n=1 Tax=Daktulosphaira vitifoliae TaxID=58002 RepID=UPI0021AA6D68|nr:uncharacterized protein LOC126894408 isoform X2 [Daktulosphaira vitifoliae]